MSESNSKIESQFASFFTEQKNSFSNLKMEKECSEEDEMMMDIKPIDELNEDLTKFNEIDKLDEFEHLNQINNQVNSEMNVDDKLNDKLNEFNQLNDVNKLNDQSNGSANKPLNEPNKLTPTVDSSSLSNCLHNLVNKFTHTEQSSELKNEFKDQSKQTNQQSVLHNQHLISSLNNLMQSNSQQQNNQFSQVSFCLL